MKRTVSLLTAVILLLVSLQGFGQTPIRNLRAPRPDMAYGSQRASHQTLADPNIATVPGYRVVLNRTHAFYIAEEGTSCFCIPRQEYDRRLKAEREIRQLQYEMKRMQQEVQNIGRILTR